MYDAPKIIVGLAVFLIIALFPLWYNAASGTSNYDPNPELPKAYKNCVLDTRTMKTSHMDLLNTWRDEFVREGDRIHTAPDGTKYWKSLVGTCMKCHNSKEKFCDKCHNYVGVEPYCFDCHVQPGGIK